jgi:hypothetical protein
MVHGVPKTIYFVSAGIYGLIVVAASNVAHLKDHLEQKETNALPRIVERIDQCMFEWGIISNSMAALSICESLNGEKERFVVGVGYALLSLGTYVVRSDYQKPVKNCIRRGLEKIAEHIQRSTEVVPTPVHSYELVPI